ncbi:MAG: hypothetical protein HUJ56_04810 [Erysipelotrichaceae bacterium]|nr:hypothetical protein [Erysipelotrichaceae bacterium]
MVVNKEGRLALPEDYEILYSKEIKDKIDNLPEDGNYVTRGAWESN